MVPKKNKATKPIFQTKLVGQGHVSYVLNLPYEEEKVTILHF